MKDHTLYSLGWYHDRAEVVVMDRVAGAPQPPGKGWRRGCQPLRDGRWTWLLSMPPPLYFGCWGGTGHYLWSPGGRQVPHQDGLDGPYLPPCPRGCYRYCGDYDKCQPQGLARLSSEPGRTVLDFWDRTVDSRGGSHSLFILPPGLDFAEAVRVARLYFPDIWARLDAAGVVVRLG